ncbi:Myosin type-2 heavy chain 1 [Tulasnella sp. 331]|nr:Myosin type-2 heavy chain 1 [Tulasnella sp. 331]
MVSVYTRGTRIWIVDKDQGWISAEITQVTPGTGDSVKLQFVDERGKEHTLDTSKDEAPPLRNPPLLEAVDDLATLSHLNEPSVLHTIRNRYAQHSIYTYSGIVLIAMNPFQRVTLYGPEIIQAYTGRRKGELEPHLFAIAEDAHTRMKRDNIGQTIIVSGESGAGKTESAKLIMRFLASVNGDSGGKPRGKAADESSEVEQQMLATNPILEAFGNAKTTRNDNSSRFGKYLQILFDGKQQIVGARIRTYLLERSRLVFQPETERNYHIFYQLCAGSPSRERKELGLDADINKFFYLKQGGPSSTPIAGVDDAEEFRATQQALSTVGISVEKQWAVFKLLAALLHLGNIKITASRTDSNIDDQEPSMQLATRFLGVSLTDFKKWTIKKQITTRTEKIVTALTGPQATVVRDSVSKFVYACLFEWLVAIINESIAGEGGEGALRAEYFIGVLDIYGFEHFKKNSFEQFCINYANEKLQQEFNAHVFKLEQEEYVREQIHWTFIDFSDNQACIDIIEGRLGVLSLLDEESRLPAGTDQSFVQKLYTQLDKPANKDTFKKPRFGTTAFTVAHYALDVTYEAEGFLEKNRDTVPDEHLNLLASTKNSFLKEVLDAALASTRGGDGSGAPPSPSMSDTSTSSTKRMSIIPDPGRPSMTGSTGSAVGTISKGGKAGAMTKKPTLGSIFKGSLISLMETIGTTNAHYIRCIKPNEQKKAWEFTPQQVLGQLRACGVLETIRISCAGYPTRWTFEEFVERYYMLVSSTHWGPQIKDLCALILNNSIKDTDKYQVGLTKIFFRAGMLAYLETMRSDRLNALVTNVQKNMKRMMAMKKYRAIKAAVIKIQTWWRGILARRLVLSIRKELASRKLQCIARRYMQRKRLIDVRRSAIMVQSYARGARVRKAYKEERTANAAIRLQSLLRGYLRRRAYKHEVHLVVLLQSCLRRRMARKELKQLKAEARSVSKFKEISYKLENKVVELTQSLQQRNAEKKELTNRLAELEQQLVSWMTKHGEADARAKHLQTELQSNYVPSAKFLELTETKLSVEARLAETTQKIADQEAMINKLTEDLARQTQQLEERQKQTNGVAPRSGVPEDQSVVQSLKNELANLREQLNRANAFNTLTKGGVREPPSPTLGYSLRGGVGQVAQDNGPPPVNGTVGPPITSKRGHQRRHSSAGVYQVDSMQSFGGDSVNSRNGASNRAVSVAFTGAEPQFRHMNGLDNIYDDPTEEKIRILEDSQQLDEDVLQGLIRGLKIPQSHANNTPSLKEVLFPANLISLITNEMWKYGLIAESERFLANVMQTIQGHVMTFAGEDAIIPGVFWLSNVHEILSFICVAESDMLQGIGPTEDEAGRQFEWEDYERLVGVVKHDLDSLEYNIYHSWMSATKQRLSKMIIPALIESQSLPGFTTSDGGGRLFNRLLNTNTTPQFGMDDVLNLLNKVIKSLKAYFMEESVIQQVTVELLKLIGVTSFNDLLMRRNFCSWKRAMQIQYNITRIEEWCKSHDMPEGTLQLEHLMQATKLLQLKKSSSEDIEIIYDVCWMLSPSQIQRMCTNYFVADYENPISPEILKVVASRVQANDRNDHLLLSPETPVAPETPYHALLDLPEEPNAFVVDPKTLRKNFLQAQRLCHPDAWSSRGKKEQAVAESQSSLLNTAYKTLSSPVLRAEYLLSRNGRPTLETDQVENHALIMEVMEAREELDDAGTEADVEDVRERNQRRMSETLNELEEAFGRKDFDTAKTESVRLKYWEGIEEAARAKLRDS